MYASKSRVIRIGFLLVSAVLLLVLLYTGFELHPLYDRQIQIPILGNVVSKPAEQLPSSSLISSLPEIEHAEATEISTSSSTTITSSSSFPTTVVAQNISHKQEESSSSVVVLSTQQPLPTTTPSGGNAQKMWQFNPRRDAKKYTLSAGQCDSAFPGLFAEIDGAVAHQKLNRSVIPEDLDISWRNYGAARVMIYDQEMNRNQTNGDGQSGHLRVEKKEHYIWIMSDFGYWSWPLDYVGSYQQVLREVSNSEVDFDLKKKQVVWRGSTKVNELRKQLVNVTLGKEWADVKEIDWLDLKSGDPLSMPQHCAYQFLVQTEGHTYSGRGKYLQNCNSVIIMQERTWVEPHHAFLIGSGPNQNFVEVTSNFTNLESKVEELLENPARARQIAQNGVDTFRDSFKPEGWVAVEGGGKKIRGTPFETLVVKPAEECPVLPECSYLQKVFMRC
ncbi:hypothetical protein G7Y89_g5207 [Cudoniella acicularis]|uniref:Glycosyl transferase CAP10 domain-containing protein n=1 Tax=Cudoniella acicularis TaxID=354080 RepID=A0A8H4W5X6_9HELO|nr:hypothetical protein G7Y89_g5207 [Cudoniella acicularis]